jgi:ribonuclease E
MLSERDAMLGMAERRVQAAEARAHDLEEQLRRRDAELAEARQQALSTEAAPAAQEPESEPLTPQFMSQELSKMIAAAEETTAQILSRARESTREQILEADRLWRDVQSEAVRFATWRTQAEAVVMGLQTMIEQARQRIESVPARIQDALGPAVEAMIQMDEGISRFAQASQMPLLVAPSGLEMARASAEQPAPAIPVESRPPAQAETPEASSPEPVVAPSDAPPAVQPAPAPGSGLWDESVSWGSITPSSVLPGEEDPIRALSELGGFETSTDGDASVQADAHVVPEAAPAAEETASSA